MFKKVLLSIALISVMISIDAAIVDSLTAGKVAYNFYKIKAQQHPLENHKISDISEIVPLVSGVPMVYVVNFSKGGFVIVAADNASRPIIGYSLNGSFPTEEIPPVVEEWMQFYYNQIEYLKQNNIQPTDNITHNG